MHQEITNNPEVGILMLTYNRERYIKAAIDSVLAQTYQNWELFVIDDGSTDNTRTILKSYHDPRIHYIHHDENKGLLVRRRESLQYTNGKYTAVLDSDDLWIDPSKLTKQVEFLENNPDHVIIGTNITIINQDGEATGEQDYANDDSRIRSIMLTRNQFAHSSVLMRTDVIKRTEGYRTSLAEDLDLFLQLGKIGKFANIQKSMTSYRVHKKSASTARTRMATQVLRIVWSFRSYYPNSTIGIIFAILRIIKSTIIR